MPDGSSDSSPRDVPLAERKPLVSGRSVTVRMGEKVLLAGADFEVAPGTFVGLLGPNGSGKTTLLRAVGGTQRYEGHLELTGREVRSIRPRDLARLLAHVRQSAAVDFDYSVWELVLMGRSAHTSWLGTHTRRDEERVREVLQEVGLSGFEERSVLSLSGGELQRTFLAQALAQEARLLLLDEPTAHLDVHYQFDLLDRVRGLTRQGFTAITVLHDLDMAARYTDALIVLDRGRVVAAGKPADVLTPELIGDVFRMHASVEREGGRISSVRLEGPVRPAHPAG